MCTSAQSVCVGGGLSGSGRKSESGGGGSRSRRKSDTDEENKKKGLQHCVLHGEEHTLSTPRSPHTRSGPR